MSMHLGGQWMSWSFLFFLGCWVVERDRQRGREIIGEENREMGRREGEKIYYFME